MVTTDAEIKQEMDSFDIYENLEEGPCLADEVEKLQQQVKELEERSQFLENDVGKLTTNLTEIKQVRDNLARNISELYKTAKAEIERKDKVIAQLRNEVDQYVLQKKLYAANKRPRENSGSSTENNSCPKKTKRDDTYKSEHTSTEYNRSRSRSRSRDRYRYTSSRSKDDRKDYRSNTSDRHSQKSDSNRESYPKTKTTGDSKNKNEDSKKTCQETKSTVINDKSVKTDKVTCKDIVNKKRDKVDSVTPAETESVQEQVPIKQPNDTQKTLDLTSQITKDFSVQDTILLVTVEEVEDINVKPNQSTETSNPQKVEMPAHLTPSKTNPKTPGKSKSGTKCKFSRIQDVTTKLQQRLGVFNTQPIQDCPLNLMMVQANMENKCEGGNQECVDLIPFMNTGGSTNNEKAGKETHLFGGEKSEEMSERATEKNKEKNKESTEPTAPVESNKNSKSILYSQLSKSVTSVEKDVKIAETNKVKLPSENDKDLKLATDLGKQTKDERGSAGKEKEDPSSVIDSKVKKPDTNKDSKTTNENMDKVNPPLEISGVNESTETNKKDPSSLIHLKTTKSETIVEKQDLKIANENPNNVKPPSEVDKSSKPTSDLNVKQTKNASTKVSGPNESMKDPKSKVRKTSDASAKNKATERQKDTTENLKVSSEVKKDSNFDIDPKASKSKNVSAKKEDSEKSTKNVKPSDADKIKEKSSDASIKNKEEERKNDSKNLNVSSEVKKDSNLVTDPKPSKSKNTSAKKEVSDKEKDTKIVKGPSEADKKKEKSSDASAKNEVQERENKSTENVKISSGIKKVSNLADPKAKSSKDTSAKKETDDKKECKPILDPNVRKSKDINESSVDFKSPSEDKKNPKLVPDPKPKKSKDMNTKKSKDEKKANETTENVTFLSEINKKDLECLAEPKTTKSMDESVKKSKVRRSSEVDKKDTKSDSGPNAKKFKDATTKDIKSLSDNKKDSNVGVQNSRTPSKIDKKDRVVSDAQTKKYSDTTDTDKHSKAVPEISKDESVEDTSKIDKDLKSPPDPKTRSKDASSRESKEKNTSKKEKSEDSLESSDRVLRSAARRNSSKEKMEKSTESMLENQENQKEIKIPLTPIKACVSSINLTHEGEIPVLHLTDSDRSPTINYFLTSPVITSSPLPRSVDFQLLKEDLNLTPDHNSTNNSSKIDNLSVGKNNSDSDLGPRAFLNTSSARKRRRVVLKIID